MKREYFEFKQFTIFHNKCAMKVGTDGVLLGAWTDVGKDVSRILDIGTGTGLIAIMLAQKCNANIIGIDIDRDAIGQAQENAQRTQWANRLQFLHEDISDYNPEKGFELIVCNPPFFENSMLSPDLKRCKARHNGNMPFGMLIDRTYDMLKEDGLFNVILPSFTAEDFAQQAWEKGLELHKKTTVYSKVSKFPKRTLLSFKKGTTCYPETIPIYIYDEKGDYTQEYRKLTRDYYLHF